MDAVRPAATPRARAALRRLAPAAVAAAALLPTTAACTFVNPQTTTTEYQPADGLDVEFSGLGLYVTQLLVITRAEGEPGTVLARVVNESSTERRVTFSTEGFEESVTVSSGETLAIGGVEEGSEELVIDAVSEGPGLYLTMRVGVEGDDGTTQELSVPVLDGTLDEYEPYVPRVSPSPAAGG